MCNSVLGCNLLHYCTTRIHASDATTQPQSEYFRRCSDQVVQICARIIASPVTITYTAGLLWSDADAAVLTRSLHACRSSQVLTGAHLSAGCKSQLTSPACWTCRLRPTALCIRLCNRPSYQRLKLSDSRPVLSEAQLKFTGPGPEKSSNGPQRITS